MLDPTSSSGPSVVDWPSIEAAAAGDSVAAERFCREWQPFVLQRLRARFRASPLRSFLADAAQEVFVECLRPEGALARVARSRCADFTAYLAGVVRNVAARFSRREARRSVHWHTEGDLLATHCAPAAPPAEHEVAEAMNGAVASAVAGLDDVPADARHTLGDFARLHFRDGHPVRWIAHEWHTSPARVHEVRRRACRALRRQLVTLLD